MYKPTIRTNLTILSPDITAANNKKLVYTLGETNTYCGQGANISTMAGTALWFVEHALFAATLNIQQLYMHHGIGFKYNMVRRNCQTNYVSSIDDNRRCNQFPWNDHCGTRRLYQNHHLHTYFRLITELSSWPKPSDILAQPLSPKFRQVLQTVSQDLRFMNVACSNELCF